MLTPEEETERLTLRMTALNEVRVHNPGGLLAQLNTAMPDKALREGFWGWVLGTEKDRLTSEQDRMSEQKAAVDLLPLDPTEKEIDQ